jgi:hypothetical protein
MKSLPLLICVIIIMFTQNVFAQGKIYDDFSVKALPGWVWGGVEMKYSHDFDNRENGFAEIFTVNEIKSRGYIGQITLIKPFLFTPGNYVNIMLEGVNNDVNIIVHLMYDINLDNIINHKDVTLTSKPLSLNFNGWKEIKIKLDQENFEIVSTYNEENFEVTEVNLHGMKIEFTAGEKFKQSKFHSGIAFISEIQNKETLTYSEGFSKSTDTESFFKTKNYPNPFNPTTTITYTLPFDSQVSLVVYDRLGREIQTLVNKFQPTGTYSVDFHAYDFTSGIYFYRIKTSQHTEVRKMLLAK